MVGFVDVEQELVRRASFRALRESFVARCRAVRKEKGGVLSCFSKWHFACLRCAAASTDPLLPAKIPDEKTGAIKTVLSTELVDEGFSPKDAAALSSWLQNELSVVHAKLIKRLKTLRQTHSKAQQPIASSVSITRSQARTSVVDISYEDVTMQLSDARCGATVRSYDLWAVLCPLPAIVPLPADLTQRLLDRAHSPQARIAAAALCVQPSA